MLLSEESCYSALWFWRRSLAPRNFWTATSRISPLGMSLKPSTTFHSVGSVSHAPSAISKLTFGRSFGDIVWYDSMEGRPTGAGHHVA